MSEITDAIASAASDREAAKGLDARLPAARSEVGKAAESCARLVPGWGGAHVSAEDISGKGGGLTFRVTRKAGGDPSSPEVVVLHTRTTPLSWSQGALPQRRKDCAARLAAEHGLGPQWIAACDKGEYYIEPLAGEAVMCQGAFNYFDPAKAPIGKLAKLLADFHQMDHTSLIHFREEARRRYPTILGSVPDHSHMWAGGCYGFETGCVFMGHWPHVPAIVMRMVGDKVFNDLLDDGVMEVFARAEVFSPVSKPMKRIVCCHGDFKPDNLLYDAAADKVITIDFDNTSVGPAVMDFDMCLVMWLGERFQPLAYRQIFMRLYLEASGQPASDADVRACLLDAEIHSVCSIFNTWLNGSCHCLWMGATGFGREEGLQKRLREAGIEGTVVPLLANFCERVRADESLQDEVLEQGLVRRAYREPEDAKLRKYLEVLRQEGALALPYGLLPDDDSKTPDKPRVMALTEQRREAGAVFPSSAG